MNRESTPPPYQQIERRPPFPMQRGAAVTMLVLDVDGVLTDGRITIDNGGVESKHFNVRDGHGIKLLQRAGIKIAILTGRNSEVVNYRAAELKIEHTVQGCLDKAEGLRTLAREAGVTPQQCAMMGDDIVDLPAMRLCGLTLAPSDAHIAVRRHVDWFSRHRGGRGAVRQVCEGLILAHKQWQEVIEQPYGITPKECGW
ncbi:MAG: HAD-IIIA family hydrolase [Mariprofundales bacterium]|nr:HAD-IIIA family hydrolase [Mariprofundales bacterium]